ncbi:MAG: CCA tRNA nucleotidyltransferase [Alphaproteobacteria bacterium]|nr:CCA tRNA nucleotidyltransferase [Alphaproteobacteria bacterium]
MEPVETIPVADWMRHPAAVAVLSALAAGGHVGRFVGGAVRNHLLGLPVTDFDIATDATPERALALGRAAGLKAVPTGLEHGTVTLVVDREPVEVTTLRRDVETDGRRAVVAFTDDWVEDAQRRDFTLNAVYLDADGTLYDPTGLGIADARARRIRFVGDPETRIREDVLRILRFFRFHAAYGRGALNPDGQAACAALAPSMARLSGERIWKELSRLLVAAGARDVLVSMAETGVARHLWDGPVDAGRAAALIDLEERYGLAPDALRRLAALVAEPDGAEAVAERLRLSRAETRRLALALATPADAPIDDRARRAAVYRHGAQAFVDARLLRAAQTGEEVAADLALAAAWTPPAFPLGGGDVTRLGIPPGPRVGELLRRAEEWWIMGDFAADAETCRAALARLASQGGDRE